MEIKKIKLTPSIVKEFVSVSSQCDFDIDVMYHHFIFDAKSVLGLLAMDFSNILTVKYCGQNQKLERMLQEYAVA